MPRERSNAVNPGTSHPSLTGRSALARLEDALAEIAGAPVALERPSDPAHGDYATNVALRLAATRRQAPLEIAAEIAAGAVERGLVEHAEAAPPGFVNVRVSGAWLADALGEILGAGDSYGAGSAVLPERVQVEAVSANPTGPLTVAHGRNGAYGDSVARLLAFAGHTVELEFYSNDTGAQIDLFRASVDAARRGEDPPEGGYRGEYVSELATLDGDPVARMLEQIEASLERFRIRVDTWERQTVVEAEIPEAIALLDTFEEDGALWARTSAHGDDKDRVVVRSDGLPTYFAADAAYVRRKYAKGFDRLVYVLGADHHGYVNRLQALAEMLGHPRDSVEVLIYQLVQLVERGEAKKMSKRRGDVVFLDEFVEAIGVDAARWYLVSRGHDQPIDIDVDVAAEKTQKNPVYYVQYAHARISGILRNAAEQAMARAGTALRVDGGERLRVAEPELRIPFEHPVGPLAPEERDLVKRLLEFPTHAAEAAERRAPHALPTYAIRVADDFHRFYHEHRVLESESEGFRLSLCVATQRVLARCLDLIGVEAPERM
jgi:arginyl-tRNA synthetase